MGAMRLATLALVAALAPTLAHAADPAAALAERVLAAYGGRAALEKVRVVREEGTVTSMMHGGSAGAMTRYIEYPASLHVEITYPGETPEVRVVHGAVGDRDGVDVRGTIMHDAMVLQAVRLSLPLVLVLPGARLSEGAAVERGGSRLRTLRIALPGGLELVAEIDPSTSRIVRSTSLLPGGPDGKVEFATEYSDFRKVGAILFAFHEENWARGHHTGATTLAKIEVLPAAPPGTFDERL
jgi:hypothetical protein